MPTRKREFGEFCWINMITPKPDEARAFFGKVLGWTYADIPGLGHLIQVDGRPMGGLFDLDGPNCPPGTPPVIGVMVKVENADATVEKVKQLGGKAEPAFDIMDNGRMAVCTDPNGAVFDLWEPKKQAGTDVDSELHGATSWFENMTTDVDRASKFYSALFAWKPESMPMEGFTYTTFKVGDTFVAGMMQITPEMGKIPPFWGTYFTVNDTDEVAKQAVDLGGTLSVPPLDIPGVGRFCGIQSPQGVRFYAIKYARVLSTP